MNKKFEKGITLIALIITIIILLILAVVTIGSLNNSDIITYAQNASTDYNAGKDTEAEKLSGYETLIESKILEQNSGNKEDENIITISEAQSKGVLNTSTTTNVKDEYGNIIKLPAGFKITTDSNNVTEGIVIEDCTDAETKGSQFVWIPIGTVYTSQNQESRETINLDRYTFDSSGVATAQGDKVINGFQELQSKMCSNSIAKDLNGFITSAITNKGYYIGRYEAGTTVKRNSSNNELTSVIVKADLNTYNYVSQPQASSLSQSMYESNNQTNVTSDLINSYAWDTAILFIQTFSKQADASIYSKINKSTSFALTGKNGDEYCKINDMSGNVNEWSTESLDPNTSGYHLAETRGGGYYRNIGKS